MLMPVSYSQKFFLIKTKVCLKPTMKSNCLLPQHMAPHHSPQSQSSEVTTI